MNAKQEAAQKFANFVTSLGFVAYLAESGKYGFVTDESEARVLSFSFDDLAPSLSGNYWPPSTTSGTGWRMDATPGDLKTAEDVRAALYAHATPFCGNGWKRYSSVKDHLDLYGASSRYRRAS